MLKVGIIGSGFGLYGLLPAFHSLKKNCLVASVCANNPQLLSKYYYNLSLKNVYSDWQEMLEKERLDAVAIAVTPKAQYKIAKAAIKKRLNVFLEKPLADTYEHAKILYDLARKNKITHAVDFIFPEIDEWVKVKKMLDEKKFGRLAHISVNWNFLSYDIKNNIASWKTDASIGGGALSFYFSHSLYYLEHFAGEIVDIKSNFSYSKKSLKGGEVKVDLILKFKKHINGYAHLSCNTVGLNRHQLIFQCEKGTIILENKNSIAGNFKISTQTENRKKVILPKKIFRKNDGKERVQVVKIIAERFILACKEKKQIKPSIKEGLRVQYLIKKIKAQNL